MLTVNLKRLLQQLNDYTALTLEQAVNACMQHSHYEVTIDHWLLQLLANPQSDISLMLEQQVNTPESLRYDVHTSLDRLKRGNTSRPTLASSLFDWIQDAWLIASLEQKSDKVRSSSLLLALIRKLNIYNTHIDREVFSSLSAEQLLHSWESTTGKSIERALSAASAQTAEPSTSLGKHVQQFCVDLTAKAKEGRIDPIFGRDREIQQMIDILARRRKNNPILVGEPGVGKTALAEGLALQISKGQVPDLLKNNVVLALDLASIEAGASVKGEYERRLKAILHEVSAAPVPIILFIDEAHTLIGSGQQPGGLDAANILKPALVRGELCTIAATTWHEYKKYFEKDPALARRFQLVKIHQPDIHETVRILRGLKPVYEQAHDVIIRDDALQAAAELSTRYITGRQQPDKAIDLLDTAAARVKVNLTANLESTIFLEHEIAALEQELAGLTRDKEQGLPSREQRIKQVKKQIKEEQHKQEQLVSAWETEKKLIEELMQVRSELAKSRKNKKSLMAKQETLINQLDSQSDKSLLHYEVSPEVIAKVVSDWSGVPLGKLLRNEYSNLLNLEQHLAEHIKGQSEAIDIISRQLKASKTGLSAIDKPAGVFLLVGPSGVGKTETALTIADRFFGGRHFLTTINMSEFQEKHSVSRLIGSPPGYVGFGEGGRLTEAVRQRPYSVVLLDEVEKAALDVMNLFYQVFDKGSLTDGEGEEVNFKNTVIFLTSNLASELIMRGEDLSHDELVKLIRPILSAHFLPALLARMTIIIYRPLTAEILKEITRQKIEQFKLQLGHSHNIELVYEEEIIDYLANECSEPELGAREIDLSIHAQIMPQLAKLLLEAMTNNEPIARVQLQTNQKGIMITAL